MNQSAQLTFDLFPPLFYYLPPRFLFSQPGEGRLFLRHTPQPHARSQKPWPASCWRGKTVFTVTPFWRRGLIPQLSGSIYMCVCVRVCVRACQSHGLSNIYVYLPTRLLNFFGGSLSSYYIKFMCVYVCTYVILCELCQQANYTELNVNSVHIKQTAA